MTNIKKMTKSRIILKTVAGAHHTEQYGGHYFDKIHKIATNCLSQNTMAVAILINRKTIATSHLIPKISINQITC